MYFQYEINFKNSSRDLLLSRNSPNIELVTVLLLNFSTPLITIHMCLKDKGKSVYVYNLTYSYRIE